MAGVMLAYAGVQKAGEGKAAPVAGEEWGGGGSGSSPLAFGMTMMVDDVDEVLRRRFSCICFPIFWASEVLDPTYRQQTPTHAETTEVEICGQSAGFAVQIKDCSHKQCTERGKRE